MERNKEKNSTKILKNLYIALVFLFLYLPILIVVIFSFNTSKMNIVWHGFTLKWYTTFFKSRTLMEALENTLFIGVISTVVSTSVGTLGALGLNKYNFKGKALIDKLLYIPIVIPEIVLGIALLSIYTILNFSLGITTMILAHITFSIPYVVTTVRARIAGMDKSLEEAAMDLGARPFKVFRKITLPLIAPGVLSGAMLSFSLSIDDVVISFFTNGPGSTTLPLKIYSMVKTGVRPDVNALSTVIILIMIVGIIINTIFQVRKLKKVKS